MAGSFGLSSVLHLPRHGADGGVSEAVVSATASTAASVPSLPPTGLPCPGSSRNRRSCSCESSSTSMASNREYAPGRGRPKHEHGSLAGAAITLEIWPDEITAGARGEADGGPRASCKCRCRVQDHGWMQTGHGRRGSPDSGDAAEIDSRAARLHGQQAVGRGRTSRRSLSWEAVGESRSSGGFMTLLAWLEISFRVGVVSCC